MKTKHLKWLWPLLLLPLFRQGAVAQTEKTTDTIVLSDTVSWTWTAKADEVKTFSFSVTEPGHYRIWWGDGDMNDYFIHGTVYERTHRYIMDGSYQVKVFGIGAATPEDYGYTETAFGINMKMVYVEGGTFLMGSTPEMAADVYSNAKPVHSVTLADFYIGETEVTQKQWETVMGTNPCSSQPCDDCPVYSVSWYEAVAFCDSLSKKTGMKYCLPTEAMWEYAGRGGQNADSTGFAGSNDINEVAWWKGNSYSTVQLVKQKKPNGLGLYDMTGNVSEWCQNRYYEYSNSSATNPQGPSSGSYRVNRGGNFTGLYTSDLQLWLRCSDLPDARNRYLGFRVAVLL